MVGGLGSGKLDELLKVDGSVSVLFELCNDEIDELVAPGETHGVESLLKLKGINGSASIMVEEVEGSLDFEDFLSEESPSGVVIWVESLRLLRLGTWLGNFLLAHKKILLGYVVGIYLNRV